MNFLLNKARCTLVGINPHQLEKQLTGASIYLCLSPLLAAGGIIQEHSEFQCF